MELASYSIMNLLESLRIFGPHSWAFQQLMYLQYVHLDSGPRGAYHVRGWIGHFRWFGFWVRWGWGEAQNILCPTSWWRIQQMFTNSSGLRCKNIYTCQLLSHKHHKLLSGSIWGKDRQFSAGQVHGVCLGECPFQLPQDLVKGLKVTSCTRKDLHGPSADWGSNLHTTNYANWLGVNLLRKLSAELLADFQASFLFTLFHTLIAHSSHQNKHTACFNRAWSQN